MPTLFGYPVSKKDDGEIKKNSIVTIPPDEHTQYIVLKVVVRDEPVVVVCRWLRGVAAQVGSRVGDYLPADLVKVGQL